MMSKLEKLEEELYGKDEGEEVARRMKKKVFFPGTLSKIPSRWAGGEGARKIPGVYLADGRILRFFLWGLAVMGIVGVAFLVFLYLGTRGQEAQVVIHGRDRVEAGEAVNIPIVVKNVSRTVLREAEVAVVFPSGFLIRDDQGVERPAPPRLTKGIPDLAPGKEMEFEIAARIFGRELEEKELGATVLYRPENLRARFSARTSYTFTISRVPLALSWQMPDTLSSGENFEFKISYSSTARGSFENTSLRIDYPPGFTFVSASPSPSTGSNIWSIGTVEPGREGTITLRGTISGGGGEVKTFLGGVGKFDVLTKEWKPYVESSRKTKIVLPPISLEALLDGARDRVVSPGDRLRFTIHYKNNTEFTLKNVSLETLLEGTIVDLGTLSIEDGGAFDGGKKTLLWNPGGTGKLREIEPGEEGDVHFSVSTHERPPVRSSADQNLLVRLHSSIEAKTVPSEFTGVRVGSEDNLELKVRSKILFGARVLYKAAPLATSGPLPPRVGARTSYDVVWEVRNFTNALDNVEVRASLPPNVTWGNTTSQDARISFDQQAGEVRWRTGQVKAGTGVLSPALTSAFLVSILPSEADIGKVLTLLQEVRLTARDTFTGENVEVLGESLTTELKEDSTTTSKDWVVAR